MSPTTCSTQGLNTGFSLRPHLIASKGHSAGVFHQGLDPYHLGGGNGSIWRTANVTGLAEYGSCRFNFGGFCGGRWRSMVLIVPWRRCRCLRGPSVEAFVPFRLENEAEGSWGALHGTYLEAQGSWGAFPTWFVPRLLHLFLESLTHLMPSSPCQLSCCRPFIYRRCHLGCYVFLKNICPCQCYLYYFEIFSHGANMIKIIHNYI